MEGLASMGKSTRPVATSKLSRTSGTVVPREIRERLGLRPGDTLRYRVTKAGVRIDESPAAADGPFVEFVDWADLEDEEAFKDL